MHRILVLCVIVAAAVFIRFYCYGGGSSKQDGNVTMDTLFEGIYRNPELVEHSKEFDRPEIIKVTDEVYVAIGYALANSIMIIAPEGLIIVDTTESYQQAKKIFSDFRKISNKPVKAVIYTHSHSDHVVGTEAFIEDSSRPPEVWGHQDIEKNYLQFLTLGPKNIHGAVHQIGTALGPYLINSGLGPRAYFDMNLTLPLFPNRLVSEGVEHNIAGMKIVFLHIPGETPDQIAVWLPEKKVLLPGDDVYKTFPNLYAIRGTPPRSTMEWANSVDKMRRLNADYLVPSHTRPVVGRENINSILTAYVCGIKFVHDQSVRLINKGLHPDEIGKQVKLPKELEDHRFLKQFYGNTFWSSKGVYDQYIGWFSGDPVELLPLTPKERSEKMIKLLGIEKLLDEAETAYDEGDLQWGLELVSYVFRIQPDHQKARRLRSSILKKLAGDQSNPNARNFYMVAALNDHGLVDWRVNRTKLVIQTDVKVLIENMQYRLKAEVADGANVSLCLEFNDTSQVFLLRVQYSVLLISDVCDEYDVKIVTSTLVWKEILVGRRSPSMSYMDSSVQVEGGLWVIRRFMSYFETNV